MDNIPSPKEIATESTSFEKFNSQNVLELITQKEYEIKDGILEIELQAMSGLILKKEG